MLRKARGEELDQKIDKLLAEMISQGHQVAPISRVAVQKRLGLKSRGTLCGKRARQIEEARAQQLRTAGINTDGKRRRIALEEQNKQLRLKISGLQAARDQYVESLMNIVQTLQRKGIDVEQSLIYLRPNFQAKGEA
jgi:hypothetical protein